MKGSEERLVSFMEGSKKRFVIPVYQRNYDWKIEHCKQLYDDLIKVTVHNLKSHFFGSIVSVYNPDGSQDEFLIIDGQQRLTTISLMFLAMYDLITKGVVVSKSVNLGQRILEEYLIDKWQPQDTRIKLKPIKNDQLAFERLFSVEIDYVADSNLTINYSYFCDRIQKAEINIDDLFESVSKLEIINIKLNNDDNPQLIFESLNSTGLDLSEGDKIRNYVLMSLPGRQQELLYDKYWSKIEHCTLYEVSSFIRDYLSIKQLSTPAIKNVYFKFKEYVEDCNYTDIEALLDDLLHYARRYEFLLKANTAWGELNNCIYRLSRIKTTVTRPFLMEALRMKEYGLLSTDEVYIIFYTVENYLFRRYICDLPTNSLNKIFLMLHNDILRLDGTETDYCEKFKYVLQSKKETSRLPDNEEFVESLKTKNIYNMRGESKLYLFERLENEGTIETKSIWEHFDKGEYSIEHIMPQQLSSVWVNELGDDYENIYHCWLHRLANLTLTAYNPEYSNRPFADKRDMEHGFKQSGLRLNQWVGQQSRWGEAELEERNELLMASALRIWPQIESMYTPPKKQYDSVTLDEEMVFTGKSISKFSLMGIEQVVDSWIDMYQQVLIQLNAMDKSVLTRLAVCNDSSIDLATHFSASNASFTSYRTIDNSIFVWTGTDTQYKINVLKKIFVLFDIDPTELVFYLQSNTASDADEVGRHSVRMKYWAYVLPILREVTGIFNNVNPAKTNWINGYLGISGVHVTCVANMDSARVELNMEMPSREDNKRLFDFLHAKRSRIESDSGNEFLWDRNDDIKASKVYLILSNVSISNESDWESISQFHAEGCKTLIEAFKDSLSEYFSNT